MLKEISETQKYKSLLVKLHDKQLYLGKCRNETYYFIQLIHAIQKIDGKLTQ